MTALTDDHAVLDDNAAVQRYFAKFDRITGHLGRVAAELENQGRLTRTETRIVAGYVQQLRATFQSEIKDAMIRQIVGELRIPTRLQFTMSQRLYYESLRNGGQFWARNDPDVQWLGEGDNRRTWLLHWAVYDTQINLPVIYLMEVEDSNKQPLPRDDRRWPQVQAHLMAQSLGGLKLLTIARGIDTDFDDLHPKRLRRIHLGPMYSGSYTLQSGPISEVLAAAKPDPGSDWALVWTIEELLAERAETVKTGWFSSVERQIFTLDMFAAPGVTDIGATSLERMIILPERPYQALAEKNPPGFANVRKFVVGDGGRVIAQR